MSDGDDMTARHNRLLAELAELGMSLARSLHAQAETAEDPKVRKEAVLAFHRVSRSVRQTLALEAKLERDRQRVVAEREARAAEAAREHAPKVRERREQLEYLLDCVIWDESERDEGILANADRIYGLLDDETAKPGFVDEPLAPQVKRILRGLGLPEDAASEYLSGHPLAYATGASLGGAPGSKSWRSRGSPAP